MTNVRSYTQDQLITRMESLDSYFGVPNNYHGIGVRSQEDEFNKFDDKFYLFKGTSMIKVIPITTNAGSKGLEEFHTYNDMGVAVLKSNESVEDFWVRGLHRGKVMAYRQDKPFPYYRDGNYDKKNDEVGIVHNDIIYANFHPATYIKGQDIDKEFINGWSLACQVAANRKDYDEVMEITENQNYLSYTLLKEFEVPEV